MRNSSISEKPVRYFPRRLADWINSARARKVHSLVDKVYKEKKLHLAWEKVKANRGAGGIDGVSLKDFEAQLQEHLKRLEEELRTDTYQPQPVRQKMIPKPGYRKDGHWYLAAQPSEKAIRQAKEGVAALLRPGNQDPWEEVVARLNRILRGWANYFRYGTRLGAYRAIDNYVYHRAADFLRRRHKVRQRCIRRFSDAAIFEDFKVQRLRALHVGAPACATT